MLLRYPLVRQERGIVPTYDDFQIGKSRKRMHSEQKKPRPQVRLGIQKLARLSLRSLGQGPRFL